jgi:transcriptional/translational regulatory protein YebC/TACO1
MVTAPEEFTAVQEALEARNIPLSARELAMLPQTTVEIPAERVNQVLRLMEALEDHDDVQKVWANFNIDENVLAAASR